MINLSKKCNNIYTLIETLYIEDYYTPHLAESPGNRDNWTSGERGERHEMEEGRCGVLGRNGVECSYGEGVIADKIANTS